MPKPSDFIKKNEPKPPDSMAQEQQMFKAVVANDAYELGDEVFVTVQAFDGGVHKFGPVVWAPIVTGTGVYYPKAGANALIGKPDRTLQIWMSLWKEQGEPDAVVEGKEGKEGKEGPQGIPGKDGEDGEDGKEGPKGDTGPGLPEGVTDYGLVTVEELEAIEPNKGDRAHLMISGKIWDLIADGDPTATGRVWAKEGGPPIQSEALTKLNATNTAPSAAGAPQITAPIAMHFGGFFGCQWMQQAAAGIASGVLTLYVNGVAKLETAAIGGNQFETYPTLREILPVLAVEKGKLIQVAYSVQTAAVPWSFASMYASVNPIRVG